MKRPEEKTKEELVSELEQLRQRIDELETCEAKCQQAQEKVRQQKEFLTKIFNSIPYAMYVIDANDLTIKLASTAAAPDGLPKNVKCYSYIHKKSKPCGSTDFVCLLEQVKKVKGPVTVDRTINDEAGTRNHVKFQGFPIFDNKGDVAYMVEAHLSIEKRKRAEEALQESEQKYRKLFEEANNAIFLIDADTGYILDANREAELLLGRPIEETIGMHQAQLYAPEMANYYENKFREHVRAGYVVNFEAEVFRKDKTIMPVNISSSVITLHGRRLVQGIFRDVSKQKQVEAQLMDYQRELRSLASQLSLAEERERRRIATEVHDRVSQNMAVCSMKLGALLESAPSTRFAKDIYEIDTLIKQMINETRALTFELSSPLLYELGLEAAIEQLTEQMREQHGIQFNFTHDRQSKPLDDDVRVLVFQAVRELLVNAMKHSQASHVDVHMKRKDGCLCTTIEDDGIGFDTSQINSLSKRTRGFGLFSIRERLSLIGGHIEVESGNGSGTLVALTIPLKQDRINGESRK